MKKHLGLLSSVVVSLLMFACSGGSAPQPAQSGEPAKGPSNPQPAAAPSTEAAAPSPGVAPTAPIAAPPAPAEPSKPSPSLVVAIAGADGHGKTTLLAAISQTLAKRGLGKARSYDELKGGGGAELAFVSGDRRLVLKEFASHEALLAALGQRDSGLTGLVLVVAQAEGIAKQTREQIAAAGKARLRTLLVAQTKDDWVDDAELKDLEQGEIEQALVEAGLLAEKDAGVWEGGKFKPGTRLPFLRVSARRALEGDAKAQKAIAELTSAIEKRAGGTSR